MPGRRLATYGAPPAPSSASPLQRLNLRLGPQSRATDRRRVSRIGLHDVGQRPPLFALLYAAGGEVVGDDGARDAVRADPDPIAKGEPPLWLARLLAELDGDRSGARLGLELEPIEEVDLGELTALDGSVTSIMRAAFALTLITLPTRPSFVTTGIPSATPSRVPRSTVIVRSTPLSSTAITLAVTNF